MPIPTFRDDGWLPPGHHQATWDDVISALSGEVGSRRYVLTQRLLRLRDGLRANGVGGLLLLNGSYVSSKPEPGDFDVLLIGPTDIQARKDGEPTLAALLDAQDAEGYGYSLFYIPSNSAALAMLRALWDFSKAGVPKGVLEVEL